MDARGIGRSRDLVVLIFCLLGALASALAMGLALGVATASAAENVLEQGWEQAGNGLTSEKPAGAWTRVPEEGTPGSTEDAATHNFWHVQDNPQEQLIEVPDINPNLVQLSPGDNGHLPSAFGGTHVAWFGEASTGTYCGSDFMHEQSSLDGCTSSGVEEGSLISPPFSLVGASSAILHFSSWWEIEAVDANGFDVMSVEYSTDNGLSWTRSGLLNPASNPAGKADQPYSNTGLQSPPTWKEYLVDLTPAINHSEVKVRFNFTTGDNLYNGFRGWLIDNVRVTTPFDVANPTITSVDTCSAAATIIHGANFLLGSTVKVDGVEAETAKTPSSDVIEIPVLETGLTRFKWLIQAGVRQQRIHGQPSGELRWIDSAATATTPVGRPLRWSRPSVLEGGVPQVGVPVTFSVTGANPQTGVATTNEVGKATFAYVGKTAGEDHIVASFLDKAEATNISNEVTEI